MLHTHVIGYVHCESYAESSVCAPFCNAGDMEWLLFAWLQIFHLWSQWQLFSPVVAIAYTIDCTDQFEYSYPPSRTYHIELWCTSGVVSIARKYCGATEIYSPRCLSPDVDFTLSIGDSYKYVMCLFSWKHICVLFFSKSGDRQFVALWSETILGPDKLKRNYLWCCSCHLCSKSCHVVFYPYQKFDPL
jgi:hypothetical protein